jgi:hypothetical protein
MGTLATLAAAAAVTLAGVQPQLATIGDQLYLAFGRGDRVHVARSDDGGRSFGAPVLLPITGEVSLGMRRGPRVAVTNTAVLVAAVSGAQGRGKDGDVVLTRSTDRGRTWSQSVVINDVPGAAREGLHALAAQPNGLVVAAWLDLREKGTRIYAAVSRDHGATWRADTLVYASPSGSVCECCHPSIAIGAGGDISVMFRNSVDGKRDMYVVRSADGLTFGPAARLGVGSWTLNACPMDGGGLAVGPAGDLTAVWRREGTVFLSTPASPEQRVGDGRDAVVALSGGHRDVAWSAEAGVTLLRDGRMQVLGAGRFPSLIASPDYSVVAWEHQGQILIQRVPRAIRP